MKKQYFLLSLCIVAFFRTTAQCDYQFDVDIKFHIVSFQQPDIDACGGGCPDPHANFEEAFDPGVNEILLNTGLSRLQSFYNGHSIYFSKLLTNYISSDILANYMGSVSPYVNSPENDPNALNVFIVPRSQTIPQTNAIGGNTIILGRDSDSTWKNVTGVGYDSSFPHEVGHALGLYHTFHGNEVASNCQNTGDLVCDTPPSNDDGSSCVATNGNCFSCNPHPALFTNIMSGYRDQCRTQFTPGQVDRMRNQMLTNANIIPFVTATLNTLVAPAISGSDCFEITPGSTTHEYYDLPGGSLSTAAQFNWATTFGTISKCFKKINGSYVLTPCYTTNSGKATNAPVPLSPEDRIVRIRISQHTLSNPFGVVPSGGSFQVTATSEWTCLSESKSMQVSIDNQCIEIPRPALDPVELDANAFPNPVKHDEVQLNFDAETRGKYRVVLVNALTGQQRELISEEMEEGLKSFKFSNLGLESNLYFLRIESPNGTTTKRLLNEN